MRRSSVRTCRGPKGFTIIELLVVISIISLLVTLLLPSLAQSREAARLSVCISNIKEHALGLVNGATDNKLFVESGMLRTYLTSASHSSISYFAANQNPPPVNYSSAPTAQDANIFAGTAELYQTDCWSTVNGQAWASNCPQYYTGLGMAMVRGINVNPQNYYCPSKARNYKQAQGSTINGYATSPAYAIPRFQNGWATACYGDNSAQSDYTYRGSLYSTARAAAYGYPAYSYAVYPRIDDWGSKSCVAEHEFWDAYTPNADGLRVLYDSVEYHKQGWNVGYWDGHVKFYSGDPARKNILYYTGNYFAYEAPTQLDNSNAAFWRNIYDNL